MDQEVKRFWKKAEAVPAEGGFGIYLDERPLKTPARATVIVPTAVLAEAIAAEWNASGETITPAEMPLTGLANAAVDRVDADLLGSIARFGENDLTCYRAEGPAPLVERQEEAWDALLAWARARYDVVFATCSGVVHVPQPPRTIRRLNDALRALDPFRLAAMAPLVTISGSLVAGLAVLEQAMPADSVWEAVSLDESWQLEQWGADAEAEAALEARRRDFMAAAAFLDLLN
ncbi:MAG: ATP12 family protein [Sphingomicrobium sp.]